MESSGSYVVVFCGWYRNFRSKNFTHSACDESEARDGGVDVQYLWWSQTVFISLTGSPAFPGSPSLPDSPTGPYLKVKKQFNFIFLACKRTALWVFKEQLHRYPMYLNVNEKMFINTKPTSGPAEPWSPGKPTSPFWPSGPWAPFAPEGPGLPCSPYIKNIACLAQEWTAKIRLLSYRGSLIGVTNYPNCPNYRCKIP